MCIADISRLTVLGSGTMGRQIALCAAIHGYETTVWCHSEHGEQQFSQWAEEYLDGRIAKGRMTPEEVGAVKARLRVSRSGEDALREADLVIETVSEQETVKREMFAMINRFAPKTALLATNSSYMVSSLFKDLVDAPERLCNIHFFNPVLVMKLAEVAQGEHTAEETARTAVDFVKSLGKTPVRIYKEIDGLITNRILRALTDEAMFLVEEGYADFEGVDLACKNGLNHPLGPFELADRGGIDMRYFSSQKRWEETGIKPPGYELYKELYEKGYYGKKTGRGFYDYTEEKEKGK